MSTNPTATAFRIDAKTCLITGAASGLGLASALALLQAGSAGLTLVDVSLSALESALKGPLKGYEDRVELVSGDVGEEGVNALMVERARNRWGRAPEVVVLCAGISQDYQVPLVDMDEAVWDKVMRVNLKGSFLGLKHAGKAMTENANGGKGGSIILISSQLGLDGVPNAGAYAASKVRPALYLCDVISHIANPVPTFQFAVRGLMSSAAQELGPKGIRVNAIAPGPIDTPMLRDWPVEKRADLTAQCNLGRVGAAEEIGRTVLYLASDAGAYCSGSTIKVDGGWSKWC